MATALQNLIDAYIKRNANQEITGPVLNGVLTAIANALGTPFVGSDGYWYTYDAESGQFVKTDTPAQGETGPVGVTSAAASIDDQIGTPEVDVALNGTQLVFTFKNLKGQKGDTGETGATGPQGETGPVGPIGPQGIQGETGNPGITAAVVTIDSGTGTPSVDASISGTTLTLAFHNLKGETGPAGPTGATGPQGPQGNSGYTGAAGELEVVNNLTDGGATKALSAEMGKTLNGEVSQLSQELHTLSGKFYGAFEDVEDLPEGDVAGYAFVGASEPFAIYNFDGEDWTDSGATVTGIMGKPGVGFQSVSSQEDGTIVITLTNGDTITIDLNHDHPQYYSKAVETSNPSGGFIPDVVYSLGTLTGAVTFALAAAVTGNVNHYFWMFDTGSTAPTITWPAGITWAGGSAPTVAASKHYEVSVLGGVAYYSEV